MTSDEYHYGPGPRPTRTELFDHHDARRIKGLFGTLPNASRHLGHPIPERELRYALNGRGITPKHNDDLSRAWARWLRFFGLRNDGIDYEWDNLDNPGRMNPDPEGPLHPHLAELQILRAWQD